MTNSPNTDRATATARMLAAILEYQGMLILHHGMTPELALTAAFDGLLDDLHDDPDYHQLALEDFEALRTLLIR